ncbi:MAG: recombinase family protein [Enterocloster sp.]
MADKLRVAAYARVSTDSDDQANSLESQRRYFFDFITGHENWQLVRVYYDEGISGTSTKNRTGFHEMIGDALCGETDLILTKEVSRFARNTVDTLAYTRKLKDAGVGVIFTLDHIDTRDSDGELRLTIMASIAQEESRKTSERVKWGQQRRMEQGVVFGRDLIGYNVKNGKLKINEEEVPIVQTVFHKYTNEGKGAGVIARELLEEGMRPKRISVWSRTVILRMLRNEKYAGDLCQKKTITPNYLTHEKKRNCGEEEMIYIHNHHEPIIDRRLWNRTQEELKKRGDSQAERVRYSNRFWCSGKLYCGECGKCFVGKTKKLKNGTVSKSWRCAAAAEHGRSRMDAWGNRVGCDSSQINEKALLSAVSYCIQCFPIDKKSLKAGIIKEIRQLKQQPVQTEDAAYIQRKISEIQIKKRKMIDLFLGDLISREDMRTQNEWYEEKILFLEKQLQNVRGKETTGSRQIDGEKSDGRQADGIQTGAMESFSRALDEIMRFDGTDLLLYREILDKAVIYKDGRLEIWLKAVPFGIGLKVSSRGRGDSYHTEILETGLITGWTEEKI